MKKLLLFLLCALAANAQFYLKDGDRVVFFGDSITDQRMYTTVTETFVVTRFPKMDVRFTHSGWGGDRVSGGGGGTINERLQRDVFAYQPTVMTVMLGMNDGRYRAFDSAIFEEYSRGYEKIVEQAVAKNIRMTLIQPSPYDDVTRPPMFEGGYNQVLLKYGEYLKTLATNKKVDTVDMNSGVIAALKNAFAKDAEVAKKMIPDRVHPDWSGHLLMAAELLKGWQAPAEVSTVEFVGGNVAKSSNATVSQFEFGTDALRWMQLDTALPMPLPNQLPQTLLAVSSSDVMDRLNQQKLSAKGLTGKYELKIDGNVIGTFDGTQLANGINLAAFPTPMMKQAEAVHALTLQRTTIHNTRWRTIQVPHAKDNLGSYSALLGQLDAMDEELRVRQRAAAQPIIHRFELTKLAQ
jgi:lysophospholipase L1-like esterase